MCCARVKVGVMHHRLMTGIKVQAELQVEKLNHPQIQAAEIHAYFGEYDKAAQTFQDISRPDLAVQLFMRLGHWDRVEAIVKARSSFGCMVERTRAEVIHVLDLDLAFHCCKPGLGELGR